MVEWFNKILVIMFSVYVNDYQINWDEFFLYVMQVYWLVVYEIIGYILNFLMLGREIIIFLDFMYELLGDLKIIFRN